jgi:endonuclease-3
MKKEHKSILEKLENHYGSPDTALDYTNPLELLIATILSAQCTDVRVNIITPELFKKYKTAEDYAKADIIELQELIKTCGLYKNKSKFIKSACERIHSEFKGVVPNTRKELESLPGVGRKTANVILANVFNKDAIAVDTHVFRVSKRLGFSNGKNVRQVEEDLMDLIPKNKWSDAHHWLIYHGREICKARTPLCEKCYLKDYCQYYKTV